MDCLSRCTLADIVDDRHNDCTPRNSVWEYADEVEVGAAYVPGVWNIALGQNPAQSFLLCTVCQHFVYKGRSLRHAGVTDHRQHTVFAVLANISLRSSRKLFIFIIKECIYRIKVSKKNVEKNFTVNRLANGNCEHDKARNPKQTREL